jgi:uncharacterized protein YecE (DUF72 family)
MKIWAGTSGYSYKEWKGSFYPEDLPAKEMLRYYAGQLSAVEINNTFYRMPRREVLEGWAEQVPDGFRFSLKASRRITHFKRLLNTDEETDYLVRTASALGNRAGVILYQLPPNFKKDIERLEGFLAQLPSPRRSAFEFRHASWFEDDVYELLGGNGAALCVAETDELEDPPLVETTRWGYLRLRKIEYTKKDLADWVKRIQACGWEEAYVFFKHEGAGEGARLAGEFQQLAGEGSGP